MITFPRKIRFIKQWLEASQVQNGKFNDFSENLMTFKGLKKFFLILMTFNDLQAPWKCLCRTMTIRVQFIYVKSHVKIMTLMFWDMYNNRNLILILSSNWNFHPNSPWNKVPRSTHFEYGIVCRVWLHHPPLYKQMTTNVVCWCH